MSVNLNILANKAIKAYADTDDLVKDTTVYTTGSFYTLLSLNNRANLPVAGIPTGSVGYETYCSQSILEWSPSSDFSSGVSSSIQSCNSSSLSGSLLVYASFTDTTQGGFFPNNVGYTQKIFDAYGVANSNIGNNTSDYGISLQLTSGSNKGTRNWYFREKTVSPLTGSFIGPYGNVGVTNVMRPTRIQRTFWFFEASGYNEETNEWYSNSILPIWNFDTNPIDKPAPYNAKATIITGSNGFPEVVKYGNLGSGSGDMLKTNGCTFILPVSPNPQTTAVGWQVQCYEGSLIAYSTENGKNRGEDPADSGSFVFALNIPFGNTKNQNALVLLPTGSEIYSSSFAVIGQADTSTGQQGNMLTSNMPTKGKVISIGKDSGTGRLNTYNDSGYAFSYQPQQGGTEIPNGTISPTSITVETSDNCLIKFIGAGGFQGTLAGTPVISNTGVVNPLYYGVTGQTSQIYSLYGDYTGSLGGS